jgi:hypothetical protein
MIVICNTGLFQYEPIWGYSVLITDLVADIASAQALQYFEFPVGSLSRADFDGSC